MGGPGVDRRRDLVGVVLRLLMLADPATAGVTQLSILRAVPSFLAAAVVGVLVVRRRPRHRAGTVLLGVGGTFALLVLAESWAHFGILGRPEPLPGAVAAGWVARWIWIVVFALVALVLLVIPDGRLPSRGWRWAAAALGLGTGALVMVFALAPLPLDRRVEPATRARWAERDQLGPGGRASRRVPVPAAGPVAGGGGAPGRVDPRRRHALDAVTG